MANMDLNLSETEASQKQRKNYEAPVLIHLGKAEQLTEFNPGAGADGGGGGGFSAMSS